MQKLRRGLKNRRSLYIGLMGMAVGLIIGGFVSATAIGDGYQLFFIYSGLAAFIVPYLLWTLLIEMPINFSVFRGLTVGVLGAILAHYLTFVLALFSYWFGYHFLGVNIPTYDGEVIGFVDIFKSGAVPTIVSLLLYGGFTLPSGLLIGTFWAARQKKTIRIKICNNT